MPTIDTNGVLHDSQGRFTEHDGTGVGYDLSVDLVLRRLGDPDTCGGCGTPTAEMTGEPTVNEVWRMLCPECQRDLDDGSSGKTPGVDGEFDEDGRWHDYDDVSWLTAHSCAECGADLSSEDTDDVCADCVDFA